MNTISRTCLGATALATVLLVGAFLASRGPPGGGTDGGMNMGAGTRAQSQRDSELCTTGKDGVADNGWLFMSGSCSGDGSSAYSNKQLVYDTKTAKFTGTITASNCPNKAYVQRTGGINNGHTASFDCTEQGFPDAGFAKLGAKRMPRIGRIGVTLAGLSFYNAFEDGLPGCQDGSGWCEGGVDVRACVNGLNDICAVPNNRGFLDQCHGHASPYHLHEIAVCEERETKGHSTLLGIALDGHGIYGFFENEASKDFPELDACGGHYGLIPADPENGIMEDHYGYHYHFQPQAPYTLGCYGPGNHAGSSPSKPETKASYSVEQCKALYTQCDNEEYMYRVPKGDSYYVYNTWCPCYDNNGHQVIPQRFMDRADQYEEAVFVDGSGFFH